MVTIAVWLAQETLAPAAMDLIREQLTSRRTRRTLARSVKRRVKFPIRGKQLATWLKDKATWEDLTHPSTNSNLRLVRSIEQRTKIFKLESNEFIASELNERSSILLDAVLTELISKLPPSVGLSVSNDRLMSKLNVIQEGVEGATNFEKHLGELPVRIAELIRELNTESAQAAEFLALRLSQSIGSMSETASEIFDNPPKYFAPAAPTAWLVIAELLLWNGHVADAATAFLKSAEEGVLDRCRALLRAFICTVELRDDDRSDEILSKFRASNCPAPLTAVVVALAARDWGTVSSSVPIDSDDPLLQMIAAHADSQLGEHASGILRCRRALEFDSESIPFRLLLADQLFLMVDRNDLVSRENLLNESVALAIGARDAARKWNRRSAEAVIIAVRGLLALEEHGRAAELLRTPPQGDATDDELAHPLLRELAFEAAIDAGRIEDADRLVATMPQGEVRTLLSARLLQVQGRVDEAAARFVAFLEDAISDDRILPLQALAALGRLSDGHIRELQDLGDETSTLILATNDLARDDGETAISRLRLWRNRSSKCSQFLGETYLRLGRTGDAIDESK